jgi:trigger factor
MMQSQVSELSPVMVEVKVEVPWERVRSDLDEHFGRIAKTAKIKGFRPGKVPRNVVRKLFGRQVRGEVTAHLVEQGLLEAVQEHELQLVAQPQVDTPDLKDGEPLEFTAKCEVRPKVDRVDVSQLEIYRSPTEVSEDDVEAELNRLREHNAELRVPEPMRPARKGDQLVIDYTVTIDGNEREDLAATDREVELGEGRLLPEFDDALVGAQPGETREVEVTFAEDHGREDLRGKTAHFQIQVKELKEKVLPDLDDEFAKDMGDEYESLEDLKKKIRDDLEESAKRKADSELKEQVVDKLIETNDIPVPPSMVQQQEQQMIMEFAQFMRMTGQNMPLGEDLHDDVHKRALRRVKAAILLGGLAREQGIEIGEEAVEAKLKELAEKTGKHIAKVRVEYQGEHREALESELLEEKLMDFLLDKAHINEGPPPEAAGNEQGTADQGAEGASDKRSEPAAQTADAEET